MTNEDSFRFVFRNETGGGRD